MPVVSNTSPVLNLAIIDRLELLRRQFTDVLIPSAVLAELMADSELPGADTIRQALQAGWLRVAELRDARVAQTLALELESCPCPRDCITPSPC